jgi:hypothetical protein
MVIIMKRTQIIKPRLKKPMAKLIKNPKGYGFLKINKYMLQISVATKLKHQSWYMDLTTHDGREAYVPRPET